jgi:hypothetical protein
MPRVIKDAPLTTATARKALPAGTHWRALGEHAHIGYRKGRSVIHSFRQRLKRLWTVVDGPYRSGRPRHGEPMRRT